MKKFRMFFFFVFFIISFSAHPVTFFEKNNSKYVGVCLATQVNRVGSPTELPSGHIALLIKGACLDPKYAFPQLKECDEKKDQNQHVLVSVNPFIKNVNWLATEGFEKIFNGHLMPNQTLNDENFNLTFEKMANSSPFKGVEYHQKKYEKILNNKLDFAKTVLGYDSAMNFGRETWCAKIPINNLVLNRVIFFLNMQNKKIIENHETFNYDFFNDNCAHLVHNTLSEIGFESPIEVRVPFYRKIFNISIPGNEFLAAVDQVSGYNVKLSEPKKIFKNPQLLEVFNKMNWLPIQPFFEIEKRDLIKPNQIFNGNLKITFLDITWNWFSSKRRFDTYLNEMPKNNPLSQAKMARFEYDSALDAVEKEMSLIKNSKNEDTYHSFLKKYKNYLHDQSRLISTSLF